MFPASVWRNKTGEFHACFCISIISSLAYFKRCIIDFLNHDGLSNSILLYDEQKDVSEVIADRNYAVGEQVMIRYGKYSNAALALNFGFTLSSNIYDQGGQILWRERGGSSPDLACIFPSFPCYVT